MDCEKFESAMLGDLYGNLDEVTSAAAKSHVAECGRCAALLDGLRDSRRVAAVPLTELSSDLDPGILRVADRAWPAPARPPALAHIISLAGSWAMRPQTAMAGVFLVMIGTSLLLLRSQSSRPPATADVTVTEQGTPAPAVGAPPEAVRPKAPASVAAEAKSAGASTKDLPLPLATSASAPSATGHPYAEASPSGESGDQPNPTSQRFDAALRGYRAGSFQEAVRAFDALATNDPNAPDLWAARAVRDGKGCGAAVTRFDKTSQRHKQTPAGWDALLEGGLCYRAIGDFGTARARLNALLGVDSHKDRARAELDRIDELHAGGQK